MSDLEKTPVNVSGLGLRAFQSRPDHSLLAKLGFADEDRRSPLHDLACQYLAQPEVAEKVVRFALGEREGLGTMLISIKPEFHLTKGQAQYLTTIGFLDLLVKFAWCDQEQRNAGFRSILLRRAGEELCRNASRYDYHDWSKLLKHFPEKMQSFEEELRDKTATPPRWKQSDECLIDEVTGVQRDTYGAAHLIIEVKTGKTTASDALRQLDVYRSHLSSAWLTLVTTYDLTQAEVTMLKSRSVTHVKLGAAFQDWCKTQTEAPPAASPEV